MVKQLLADGRLVKLRRNRLGIPSELNLVVGKITISKAGSGTVLTDSGEPIVIAPADTLTALDSDKVMVRVSGEVEGEIHGKVIKVLERADRKIIGIYRVGRHFNFIAPDSKKIHRDIHIAPGLSNRARDGERVTAEITQWDDPLGNPDGKVIEQLGMPGEPGIDLLTVIKSFNLPEEFPRRVMEEAEQAAQYYTDAEIGRRRDFTR